jgi:hypothetical protein
MGHRFTKHYTREEARALLPTLREWLERLNVLRADLDESGRIVAAMMKPGLDQGGDAVNHLMRLVADVQEMLGRFASREIVIKDLARGLVDFPSLIGDREVFLCWEKDEADIEFWHDLDAGYAGREPL